MRKSIRKIIFGISLLFTMVFMASCNEELPTTSTEEVETPSVDQREEIYKMAVSSGYTGTYEEWLASIKGEAIELSIEEDYLCWKYKSDTTWNKLISLAALKGSNGTNGAPGQAGLPGKDGAPGKDGNNGKDGKTPEFRINEGYLEWKYTTDTEWKQLYKLTLNQGGTAVEEEKVSITFVTEFEENDEATSIEDYFIIKESETIEIAKGLIPEPTHLVPEGCKAEWYVYDKYEEDFSQWKFDFYYAGKDLVLYGLFEREYQITFLDENNNPYYLATVNSSNPYLNRYVEYQPIDSSMYFLGWSVDGETVIDDLGGYRFDGDTTFVPVLGEEPIKVIDLIYSGSVSDEEFYMQLFEDFKSAMKAEGDPNTYNITYVAHGADRIVSEVVDWAATDAPDVYEFTSDRLVYLYSQGALARISGSYKNFINSELCEVAKGLATFNDAYYGYPFTGDNTYYLQYDKSKITEEQAKDMMTLMNAADAQGLKVGYNIAEGYWGAGAMFTFGADYSMSFTEDGSMVTKIEANFNTEVGLKAGKALLQIVNHNAWYNTSAVPAEGSDVCAVVGGTWDALSFKALWGDNYGCAVMPTVTVDGEIANLGAFLGGKLLGINPQRSAGNVDRLEAAHKLAKFLTDKECQLKRYEYSGTVPTHIEAAKDSRVLANPNALVVYEQGSFAHPQTTVPEGLWSAPYVLVKAMQNGECTLENLQEYLDEFNRTVIGETIDDGNNGGSDNSGNIGDNNENTSEDFFENGKLVKRKSISYNPDGTYIIFWEFFNDEVTLIRTVSEHYSGNDILIDVSEWYKEGEDNYNIYSYYNDNGELTGIYRTKNGISISRELYHYYPSGVLEYLNQYVFDADGNELYELTIKYDEFGEVIESDKIYTYIKEDGTEVGVMVRYDKDGNFVEKQEYEQIRKEGQLYQSINRVYFTESDVSDYEFVNTYFYTDFGNIDYVVQHKNGLLEWKEEYTYDESHKKIKIHISHYNEFDNLTREEIQFYNENDQIEYIIETLIYFDSDQNYEYREITYMNANRGVIKTETDYPDADGNFKEITIDSI